jgi:hypothetical protein
MGIDSTLSYYNREEAHHHPSTISLVISHSLPILFLNTPLGENDGMGGNSCKLIRLIN